jgi:hypothetical protein
MGIKARGYEQEIIGERLHKNKKPTDKEKPVPFHCFMLSYKNLHILARKLVKVAKIHS